MQLNSTEARILLDKALIEYNLGKQYYTNGAFEDARIHFAYVETYMNEALLAGEEREQRLRMPCYITTVL
ncbi:hypothetical protein KEJ37_00530 [Candidatus Bathyarchaeota archaeon]|nr:hypothetical protein [Candidatus Bathyarchaeota archaeon]